jgi:hypothetical protein
VLRVAMLAGVNEPGIVQTVSLVHVAGAAVATAADEAAGVAAGAAVGLGVAVLEHAATMNAARAIEPNLMLLNALLLGYSINLALGCKVLSTVLLLPSACDPSFLHAGTGHGRTVGSRRVDGRLLGGKVGPAKPLRWV